MTGAEDILEWLEKQAETIKKIESLPKEAISKSKRLAPMTDQIKERGSIADRLAKTPEEAEIIRKTEELRLGLPKDNPNTREEDEKVLGRMTDDIIRNIFR